MPLNSPPPELLQGASLFLDFDGTLVEIAALPDAIVVGDDLRSLLHRLKLRLAGRLAVISGRSSADVSSWLAPLDVPIVGSHGLERLSAQSLASWHWGAGLRDLQILESRFPGVVVEEKPLGAAVHYRQAPQAEDECRAAVSAVAAATGLSVQPGKMVFELKPSFGNKGTAVSEMMAEPPFAGTRPVFIGDDLTDEHGFSAAVHLGGAGILVGEERPTAADYRLADVAAAHVWLGQSLEALA